MTRDHLDARARPVESSKGGLLRYEKIEKKHGTNRGKREVEEKTVTMKSSFPVLCLTRLASAAFGKRSAVNLRSPIMMYLPILFLSRLFSISLEPFLRSWDERE